MSAHSEINSDDSELRQKNMLKNKRGRPKGARTTRLADVRKQAAEEKTKLRLEMSDKINALQKQLEALQALYEKDVSRLNEEVDMLRRREGNYQQAMGPRLHEVADHLQKTLLSWGTAELEEAQVDKRGRGRPRKTLK